MTDLIHSDYDPDYGRAASRKGAFVASAALHVLLGGVLCLLPDEVELRILRVDPEQEAITYIAVPELPSISSPEGASQGKAGYSGGRHLYRPTQKIRVARGEQIVPEIVQAPRLTLPVTDEAVADLLAFAPENDAKLAQQPLRVIADLRSRRRPSKPVAAPTVPLKQDTAIVSEFMAAVSDPKLPVAPKPRPQPIVVKDSTGTDTPKEMSAPVVAAQSAVPDLPSQSYGEAVVLSKNPGSKLGTRATQKSGSIAMSPYGGSEPGVGLGTTGDGLASGTGSGAAIAGIGPGAGATGTGPGKMETAGHGLTPNGNDGGSGKNNGGVMIDGLSISGGPSTGGGQVFLGSFAAPPPSKPAQIPLGPRKAPSVMVVGTSRSGGVLSAYAGAPRGPVYTIYVSTGVGTAVIEFSEAGSSRSLDAELTAPEPLEASLPAELRETPIVIGCLLDRSGRLKEIKLLHQITADVSAKLMQALTAWRFRPVLRGDQAVEASVLIGLHLNSIRR